MNTEEFENHVLFDRLNSLTEILASEKTSEKIELQRLSRFQTVHDYIYQRVKLTLPDLVQKTEFDTLSNEINAAVSQLNSFLGNNNVGHLNNVDNYLNSAINKIKLLPIPVSKTDFNFSKKVASFENTAKKKYASLEKEYENTNKKLTDVKTNLSEKNKQIESLSKQLIDKENEIKNLTSNIQTNFKNIQANQVQSLKEDRKKYKEEVEKEKVSYRKQIEDLKENIDIDTSKLVQKLETKLKEAEQLVNVIGNVGVTGNYQIIANQHKKTANIWRGLAIAFMTIFSVLLVWTIIDLSADGYNWTKSVIRLLAAAALSYPATYAAKESTKHRNLETLNRNAELELASINPFIEILPDQKKHTIKEKLVEKYFGNNSNGLKENKKEEELSFTSFEKIIDAISKLKP
ncbi:hypothetical protein [Christiangramia sabulilitoris]|uniref:Uncharacterized protein n=1 Tax=Christiangramia sabulilitoris TaxID=2583991 RepID=A0A550I0K4_9FLAO|nr:hypothetical protein [Christiangramia sabulilitoris]TRO64512.1 hypothetical protein FGM01_13565 [Christiangramia sabulilitoris]